MPLFYNLNSLMNPSPKKREAHTRARSPIDLLSLVRKKENLTFRQEIESRAEMEPEEVAVLFECACETSNVNAIFVLADSYPDIVNSASVSRQLDNSRGNLELLVSDLIFEKEKAPASLSALYTNEPRHGVTKLFDPNQRQHIERLIEHIEEPTKVILTNGEYYDCAIAMFCATPNVDISPNPDTHEAPKIVPKNANARFMLSSSNLWSGAVPRKLNFDFPDYSSTNTKPT